MRTSAKQSQRTIVDIKRHLEAVDPIALGYEQFAADWIEEALERIDDILGATEITTDDVTYHGSLCYRVDTILEVLSTEARCHRFFSDLNAYLG